MDNHIGTNQSDGIPVENNSKWEIKLIFITAIVTLFGSSIGTYVTNQFSAEEWNRRINIEEKVEVFKLRHDLFDRTVKAFTALERAEHISNLLELKKQALLIENRRELRTSLAAPSTSNKITKEPSKLNLDMNQQAIRRELLEIKKEYNAVVAMVGLYFGGKSRQALINLQSNIRDRDWYDLDKNLIQDLYAAMIEELDDFN